MFYESPILPFVLLPYVLLLIAMVAGLIAGLAVLTYPGRLFETFLEPVFQGGDLAHSRFGRMLARRHVRIGEYLRAFPRAEIRRQLDVCRKCPKHSLCEGALAARPGMYRFSFCPNRASVEYFLYKRDTRSPGLL